MTLTLDRSVYTASDSATLTARLAIRSSTSDPVSLTFPTGQMYDLEIRNEKAAVVYRWSFGRLFAQIVTSLSLEGGEEEYVITAPLAGLPPGKYVAQAWLTADGPPREYSASAPFQIE